MKIKNFNKIVILIFFLFQHVLRFQKILLIVVQFLMKDIFGTNMQKKLSKNGVHPSIFNWRLLKWSLILIGWLNHQDKKFLK